MNSPLKTAISWVNLCPQLGRKNQNLMTNFLSHAGQSISLLPGFFFIRKRRSQPGQAISTLGVFGLTVNWHSQDAHCRLAGLESTPTMSTLSQPGQLTFSSRHFFLVPSCLMLTRAEHI